MKNWRLYRELRRAGAGRADASSLLPVVDELRGLKPAPDSRLSARKPQNIRRISRLVPAGIMVFAGVVLGLGLMALSQTSMPGDVLYPAKRVSERAAVLMNPEYKENVMMRRAREVSSLAARQASEKLVMDTLEDYKTAAASYATPYGDPGAFAYCRQYLQEAADHTAGSEHAAIAATIAGLPQSS